MLAQPVTRGKVHEREGVVLPSFIFYRGCHIPAYSLRRIALSEDIKIEALVLGKCE